MSTLILLSAMVLQAGSGVVSLAEAEQALLEGRFEAVRERASEALTQGLPPPEQVRALELLGTAEAAFGREPEAVLAFRRILWRAPEHTLSEESSPKLLALFAQARAAGPLTPATGPGERLPTGPPDYLRAAHAGKDPSRANASEASGANRWWLWAAVGGVGLGAGIAAWQLTRPELPRGSLGREFLR
ncbi:MAG TPA: hypothetical protein VK013_05420 [Myxococcaceae bacterium]|nr:hypothetical protein [Myxococcaceae bacterium]